MGAQPPFFPSSRATGLSLELPGRSPQPQPSTRDHHPPAPWEGSPSLTSCSRLLWLCAAGVHMHQELGQAPHTGTKDSTAAGGTAGQLHTLQVLPQQPGQGADAFGVCEANQTQSGVPQPEAQCGWARESTGYLG